MPVTQKLHLENNQFIAYKEYKSKKNSKKTILFLHGLYSDMNGSKASAIMEFAQNNDHHFITFDNLGHGESSLSISDTTIRLMLDASLKVINNLALEEIIIVGSSMGGWLALLLAQKLPQKVKSLILLAPAPDFTTKLIYPNLTTEQKRILQTEQTIDIAPAGSDFRKIITNNFIEDSKDFLLFDNNLELTCDVEIIHGLKDDVVPYQISTKLITILPNAKSNLHLLSNSDHRLSDDYAIKLLLFTLNNILNND